MDNKPDSAAIFACALSLREACMREANLRPDSNLSDSYNGLDEFFREMMRVANLFEEWCCTHVEFKELNDIWPYLMEDKFGGACLEVINFDAFAGFNSDDCLRVALRMHLPVCLSEGLCLPIDIRAFNSNANSSFVEYRVQSVRENLRLGDVEPFTIDDEPFDTDFGTPYLALYGVLEDGSLEHVSDRATYPEIMKLVRRLVPGIEFPPAPICV